MSQASHATLAQQTATLLAIQAALPACTSLFVSGRAILLTLPGEAMPGGTTLAPEPADLRAIVGCCNALQATRAKQEAQRARGAA